MKLTQIALPFVTLNGILEHGNFLRFQIRKINFMNEKKILNFWKFEFTWIFLNFLESDDIWELMKIHEIFEKFLILLSWKWWRWHAMHRLTSYQQTKCPAALLPPWYPTASAYNQCLTVMNLQTFNEIPPREKR